MSLNLLQPMVDECAVNQFVWMTTAVISVCSPAGIAALTVALISSVPYLMTKVMLWILFTLSLGK